MKKRQYQQQEAVAEQQQRNSNNNINKSGLYKSFTENIIQTLGHHNFITRYDRYNTKFTHKKM